MKEERRLIDHLFFSRNTGEATRELAAKRSRSCHQDSPWKNNFQGLDLSTVGNSKVVK